MMPFEGDYVARVEKLERDLVQGVAQQLGIKEAKVTERQVLHFVNSHPDEFEDGENLERIVAYPAAGPKCCGGGGRWRIPTERPARATKLTVAWTK